MVHSAPLMLINVSRCVIGCIIVTLPLMKKVEVLQLYQVLLKAQETDYAVYLKVGSDLQLSGLYQQAIRCYQKALALNSTCAAAYSKLGMILSEACQYQTAQQFLLKAIRLDPNNSQSFCDYGAHQIRMKNYEQAIASFKRAIQLNPQSWSAFINIGKALDHRSQVEEAKSYYQQALAIGMNNLETKLRRSVQLNGGRQLVDTSYFQEYQEVGETLKRLNRVEQAIEYFNLALKANPAKDTVLSELGQCYKKINKFQQAIIYFEKAIELNPLSYFLFFKLGFCFQQVSRFEEAINQYRKTIELNPNFHDVYHVLGVLFYNLSHKQLAADCARKAISIQPHNAGNYYNLGLALYSLSRYQQALDAFVTAIKLKPNFPEAINSIGGIYSRSGKSKEAIQCYQRAIELSAPCNLYVYYKNLGTALMKIDPAKSQQCFRRSIELEENNFGSFYGLAELLIQRKQFEEGRRYCVKAIRLNPSHPRCYIMIGNILVNQRKFEEAVKYLQIAKEIDPNDSVTYCLLGRALYEMGRIQDAINCQEKALQLNKNDVRAISQLQRMKKQLKKNNQYRNYNLKELQIDLSNAKDIFYLGMVFQKQADYQQAIIYYNQAIQLNPKMGYAYLRLGSMYSKKNNYKSAIPCFQKSIELKNSYEEAYPFLAMCLSRIGKTEEAISWCHKAIDQGYNSQFNFRILAEAYFLKKAYDQAIKYFTKAIEIQPRNPENHNNIVICYYRLNKRSQAIENARITLRCLIRLQQNLSCKYHLSIGLLLQRRYFQDLFSQIINCALKCYSIRSSLIINGYINRYQIHGITSTLYRKSLQILSQVENRNPQFMFNLSLIFHRSQYQQFSDLLLEKLLKESSEILISFQSLSNGKLIIDHCIDMYLVDILQRCANSKTVLFKIAVLYKLLGNHEQFVSNVEKSLNFVSASSNVKYRSIMQAIKDSAFLQEATIVKNTILVFVIIFFLLKTSKISNVRQIGQVFQFYVDYCRQFSEQLEQMVIETVNKLFNMLVEQIDEIFDRQGLTSQKVINSLQMQKVNQPPKNKNNPIKKIRVKKVKVNNAQSVSKKKKPKTQQVVNQQVKISKKPRLIFRSQNLLRLRASLSQIGSSVKRMSSKAEFVAERQEMLSWGYFFPEDHPLFAVLMISKHVNNLYLSTSTANLSTEQDLTYSDLSVQLRLMAINNRLESRQTMMMVFQIVSCFNFNIRYRLDNDQLLRQILLFNSVEHIRESLSIRKHSQQDSYTSGFAHLHFRTSIVIISAQEYYTAQTYLSQEQNISNNHQISKESMESIPSPGNALASGKHRYSNILRIVRDILSYTYISELQPIEQKIDENENQVKPSFEILSNPSRLSLASSSHKALAPNNFRQNSQQSQWVPQKLQHKATNHYEFEDQPSEQHSNSSSWFSFTNSQDYLRQYSGQSPNKRSNKQQLSQCSQQFQFQMDLKLVSSKNHWSNFLLVQQSSPKGRQFRQLLFNNHVNLIKYLHLQRNSFQYIARHYFDKNRAQRKGRDYLCFRMNIEEGLSSFIPNHSKNPSDYIDLLIQQGAGQVLNWISCFVHGIAQLQSAGIFHADLCLRNTIQREEQGRIVYKIIDFDYAFKVKRQHPTLQDQAFQQARKLLIFWLGLEVFNQHIVTDLFRRIEMIDPDRLTSIRRLWRQPVSLENKVEQLLNHIQSFMLISHRYQLREMLRTFSQHLSHQRSSIYRDLREKISQVIRMVQGQGVEGDIYNILLAVQKMK